MKIYVILAFCIFQNFYGSEPTRNEVLIEHQGSNVIIDACTGYQGGNFEIDCTGLTGHWYYVFPDSVSTILFAGSSIAQDVFLVPQIKKLILTEGSSVKGNIIFQGERTEPGLVELDDTSSVGGQIIHGVLMHRDIQKDS
ncbi:MAG TPA: hypothetical protein VLG50_02665 [Candidatus Saccharimonadales bacterium]|nr:hypothetical protein [Candidatus Saccharimonadales bacterium]